MKLDSMLEHVEALRRATSSLAVGFTSQMLVPKAPYKHWYSTWHTTLFEAPRVAAPEVLNRYGVYLIAAHAGDGPVIYIGKATPRIRPQGSVVSPSRYHLAAEALAKLGTPQLSNGTVTFPAAPLLREDLPPAQREAIINGDIMIALIQIEPWAASAMVETYL
jgi:hypothetical protein